MNLAAENGSYQLIILAVYNFDRGLAHHFKASITSIEVLVALITPVKNHLNGGQFSWLSIQQLVHKQHTVKLW